MSVSHCMSHALRIAQQPREQWQAALAAIPEVCPKTDCTGGVGCRERNADYLRIQWRMLARRDARGSVRA